MKRLVSACLLLAFLGASAPVYAQATSAIAAAQYAEQKTFDTFMHLQVVQELLVLKQNYDASVQYYNEFRQLNAGKGYFANVSAQIKTAVEHDAQQFDKQVSTAFTQPNSNTLVDQFVQGVNKGIYNSLTYTTDEALNLVAQRKAGSDIANNANGLAPKDAANLSARAQGIQIQMLTELHSDNLRLIQLLSMQLAGQTRDPSGQSQVLGGIRAGLKTRAPNYQAPDESTQGGGQ
jgi:hypothetical protein